jgi:HAMP domain-containing protein
MLRRLRIWQKFTLIAVAFAIPIVVLAYFLMIETQKVIDFSRAEVDGLSYLAPLRKLVADVSLHRDLSMAVLVGDQSFKEQAAKTEALIEADFKAAEGEDAKYADQFGRTDQLKELKQLWQSLRANMATFNAAENLKQHGMLIKAATRFTNELGNASNLILDPDVDSHYLVDALIFKIPKLHEEISQTRAIGAALYASGGQGEENSTRRQQLLALFIRVDDALAQHIESIRFALNFNARTKTALDKMVEENKNEVRAFVTYLEKKVASGESVAAKDFVAAASKPLDLQQALWDKTADELYRLLQVRITTYNRNRLIELAAVAVALALTMLLLSVVVRAITRPIAHLSAVADRISLGDMDATIDIDARDEIGELGERFRRMQVSLKAAMDALEKQQDLD